MESPYCPGPGDWETWPPFTGNPNDPRHPGGPDEDEPERDEESEDSL